MTTGGEKQGTTIAQGGFTANDPRFMAFVHGLNANEREREGERKREREGEGERVRKKEL